jgi:hypothetical protein
LWIESSNVWERFAADERSILLASAVVVAVTEKLLLSLSYPHLTIAIARKEDGTVDPLIAERTVMSGSGRSVVADDGDDGIYR